MKIVVLHTADALEPPPVDPLLDQLRDTLTALKHDVRARRGRLLPGGAGRRRAA